MHVNVLVKCVVSMEVTLIFSSNEYHTVYDYGGGDKEGVSVATDTTTSPPTTTTSDSVATTTTATVPTITTTAGPTLEASFSLDAEDADMRYIDSPISMHRFT